MKVCIEKTPDGQFSVYKENEPAAEAMPGGDPMVAAMGGESPGMESSEQQAKQPAQDLQSALMIAGKMLSQDTGQGAAPNPFDEGLKKVLPQRPGQQGM